MSEIKVTEEMIDEWIKDTDFLRLQGTTTTICQLTLKNGFVVIGTSACMDPTNFNESMGRKIAFKDAKDKCWELLGFHLATERMIVEEGTR